MPPETRAVSGAKRFLAALALVAFAALLLQVDSPVVPLRPSQIAFDPAAPLPRAHVVDPLYLPQNETTPLHPLSAADIASLFPPSRIRRVRVHRYSTTVFRSPAKVRQTILAVWQSKIESPSPDIGWDEFHFWSIDLVVETADGPSARLITDGDHACAETEDGTVWFFRLRPPGFHL